MAARRSRCHNGRTNQYEVTSSDQTPWLAREASGRPGYQSSDPGHSWVQVMGVNRATPIGGHFTLGVRWPHHYHSRLTRHGLWEARMGSGPFCPFPPIQAGDICASATHCSPLGSSQAEGPGRQTDKGSSWRAKGGPQQVRCRQKQRRLGPGRDRAHIEPGTSRALEEATQEGEAGLFPRPARSFWPARLKRVARGGGGLIP